VSSGLPEDPADSSTDNYYGLEWLQKPEVDEVCVEHYRNALELQTLKQQLRGLLYGEA